MAQARALMEFDAWISANPKAQTADIFSEAQAVVGRCEAISLGDMKMATGLPRYYDGTRAAITLQALDAAEDQTVAALDAQTLTKVQTEQELQKIET
jgi:hypothetical protein